MQQTSNLNKLIVITGSNKGIGFGILKRLSTRNPNYNFIMAVRNVKNGEEALDKLAQEVQNAKDRVDIQELDVADSKSIDNFVERVSKKYEKIDALVNNAGIFAMPEGNATGIDQETGLGIGDRYDYETSKWTFQTNYFGTVELTLKMLPYIAQNGKIIFLGSTYGGLSKLRSEELKKKLQDPNLTTDELTALAQDFIESSKNGKPSERGWQNSAYSASKLLINTLPRTLALNSEVINKNIQVYSCCPGYVATSLNNFSGIMTVDQGAVCPSDLVELPWEVNTEYQGKFFRQSKVYEF